MNGHRAERSRRQRWTMRVATIVGSVIVPVCAIAQVTYTMFPVSSTSGSSMTAQPSGRHVTLTVRDSTIEYVVGVLARQAHLQPAFVDNPVLGKRVTVQIADMDPMEAISSVLRGTGLVANLAADRQTVVVRAQGGGRLIGERQIANGTIAGRVTDSASGAGLGGAAVRVEGTKLSTVTSDSGNFVLRDVPAGDQILTVKLFGYRPVERTATVVDSQRTMVRIVMVSIPTVLTGVVTTATGTQRRIEVGNDITTLNVDSIMKIAPIQSVTDLLDTRVPGLTVVHSSGIPGAPSRIRIRGAGSIQLSNDPIVIVDGIRVYANQSDPRNQNLAPTAAINGTSTVSLYSAPSPLDQIDPNSIETIEVLKGPSASAIYGSDAAAGVIVITTKHGRVGPPRWALSLGGGINWLPGSWPVNYYKFGISPNSDYGLCIQNALELNCQVDTIVQFQALNDPQYTVFSHGSDQSASLTVSGGSPTLLYSLTGSVAGNVGNVKLPRSEQEQYDSLYGQTYGKIPSFLVRPDRYGTWSINGTTTANFSPTFSVGFETALYNSTQQQSSLDGAINQIQGEYISPVAGSLTANGQSYPVGTPLISGEYQRVTSDQMRMTNSLNIRWQPVVWLPLTAIAGIDAIQKHDVTYTPFGIYNGGYRYSGEETEPSDTTGEYGLGRGSSEDQTFNLGTEIPLFRQRMTLAVGGNLYSSSTVDYEIATDALSPGITVPTSFVLENCTSTGSATCNSLGTQQTTNHSTYGWYLEPHFRVFSRFFTSPGFRLDGGSGSSQSAGSVSGLSAFPKMDLSYLAVDRQGDRPLWGVLSQLRPRVSFGISGTQPEPADKLRLYNVGQYQLTVPGQGTLASSNTNTNCLTTVELGGPTPVPAVCLDALGNTQLRPERSSEIEGGFDASFWRNRLSITYTQYDKTRRDAIVAIPVAPSVFGYTQQIQKNIGVIRNTGTEMTVDAQVLESRAFGWHVGAKLANDNNLVVRLNPGQSPIVMNTSTNSIGGSSSNDEGASTAGIQERIQAGYPLFAEFTRPIVGFADANHDGVIEPNEIVYGDSVVYIGQPEPKYQFNLFSDITLFGRLSFHVAFAYQNGQTQINEGACRGGLLPLLLNKPGVSLSTQAAVVAADCAGEIPGGGVSAVGLVQTVNTFRFNDLSINYAVPIAVASWFHVPRMSIALQGSNLALHTNYLGLDPDVNAYSTVSAGDETLDNGQIPEPRTWSLAVSLGN